MSANQGPTDADETTSRRLRLWDLLILVPIAGLTLAAVESIRRSKLSGMDREIVLGLTLLGPLVVGGLWLLLGRPLARSNRGPNEGLSVLYAMLTWLSVTCVVMLYLFYPPASAYVGGALFAFLAYILTWM